MRISAQASLALDEPRAYRGLRHTVVAWSFIAITFLLYAVSSGLLWSLGINYSGVTGSIVTKIHPATYLAFALIGLMILWRRNPFSFFVAALTRYPGCVAFLVAMGLMAAYIVIGGRRGIAAIFDTYALAALIPLIAAELDSRDLARAEKVVHALMATNALMGLLEYAIGQRLLPYRFDGIPLEWDDRSNALLGHPLENAQMTGLYIMALLAGGGRSLRAPLRPAAVLLQLAALIPFGGRTALLLTLAMMALWMLPRIASVLRGARMSLPAFAAVIMLLPIIVLAVPLFAAGGFFDVMLDRFANDDGSAMTRLHMFDAFGALSWREILVGADTDVIENLRRTSGLASGVENPVIRLLLYQGAIFTAFLLAGLGLFLLDVARRLAPGYGMTLVFFLVIINSYESIGTKTVSLAQFVVLVLVMFPPAAGVAATASRRDHAPAFAGPAPR